MTRSFILEKHYKDEETGYECLILILPLGYRTGYVKLPVKLVTALATASVPLLTSINTYDAFCTVWGGVSYAGGCPIGSIEGFTESDVLIGFDCAHYGDMASQELADLFDNSHPFRVANIFKEGEVRSCEFVQAELANLCKGVKSMLENIDNSVKFLVEREE